MCLKCVPYVLIYVLIVRGAVSTMHFYLLPCFIITINVESDSGSVKKEKEKKNRKKDKENGSGSGDAGNHNEIDAPEAVVSASLPLYPWWWALEYRLQSGGHNGSVTEVKLGQCF